MATSACAKLAINSGEKACNVPYPPRYLFGKEELRAVTALFNKAIRTGVAFGYNGEEEEAYCKEFAEFLGGGYADAVNSGTSAIYVALRALQVEPFTEVICPPSTDNGGVMPVPLNNCIPIPADAAPGSFNAGPDEIEARITPRTSAIIVAHIAGIPAEMGPIMEIARAKNLPVIEDCAQSHAAKYKGKYVGAWGTIGAFSTMFGKHHATGGQGGVVFTRSKEIYQKIRWYSDRGKPFGIKGATSNVVCSLNLNLNDLAGCIGRVQLEKLPKIVARRRRIAHAIAKKFLGLKSARIVLGPKHAEPSYWFLLVALDLSKLTADKDTFVKALMAEGVVAEPSYAHLFTRWDWYKNRAVFGTSGYPWTSPRYKGDPDRKYPTPNLDATDKHQFQLYMHESYPAKTLAKIFAAFKKVEDAYAR
jgi:dTDP-4-amino-4,6-dideoxygalactose transaminase